MADINVNEIMQLLDNPNTGGTLESVTGMLDGVDKVLQRAEKTMSLLERMGVKELIVRAAGQKLNIDVDTPLPSAKSEVVERVVETGFKPASEYHTKVFEQMNNLSEGDLAQLLVAKTERAVEVVDDQENAESAG